LFWCEIELLKAERLSAPGQIGKRTAPGPASIGFPLTAAAGCAGANRRRVPNPDILCYGGCMSRSSGGCCTV